MASVCDCASCENIRARYGSLEAWRAAIRGGQDEEET